MIYDTHPDLASWTRTHTVVNEILNMINFDFEFEKAVDAILANIEKYTNCRGITVSEVDFSLSKKVIARSPQFKEEYENKDPLLSYPITLINNRVSHTLDVYNLEANTMPKKDAETLNLFRELLQQAVNKEATKRDPLTGLYSRAYFDSQLQTEIINAKPINRAIALLMIDIDHFKKVNDTYGHPVGDVVLEKVATVLKAVIDKKGFVSRYGGEELTVILPGIGKDEAINISEEIRSYISNLQIPINSGKNIKVTVSIGVSAFPEDAEEAYELLKASDEALYLAKNSGRNRVVAFSGTERAGLRKREEKVAVEERQTAPPPRFMIVKVEISPVLKDTMFDEPVNIKDVHISNNNIFLLDSLQSRVYIFNLSGELINTFGKKGEGTSENMIEPTSISVDREGWIWITDSGNHAVKVFDPLGKSILTISATIDEEGKPIPGTGKGCFNLPYSLMISDRDEVIVVERMNRRVQIFDRMGNFKTWTNIPQKMGSDLHRPDPVDICPDGYSGYLVLDTINSSLIHFSAENEAINFFGEFGSDEGKLVCVSAISYYPKWRDILSKDAKPIIVTAEMGDVNRIQFFTTEGDFIKSIDLSPFTEDTTIRPANIFCSDDGGIYIVPQLGSTILYLLKIK